MRRQRTLGSVWDPGSDVVGVAPGIIPGQVQYRGGNEMFGTGFCRLLPTEFAWLPNGGDLHRLRHPGPPGTLVPDHLPDLRRPARRATTRSPSSPWGCRPGGPASTCPGPGRPPPAAPSPARSWPRAWPTACRWWATRSRTCWWTPPGVHQLPCGIPVHLPAAPADPRQPQRHPPPPGPGVYGRDPFVVAGRTTTLSGFGTVDRPVHAGGHQRAPGRGRLPEPGQTWNLADFLAQGLGQYNVVHRPRGPQGLFTLQGAPIQPTPPASSWNTALNAWWSPWSQQSGPLAFGADLRPVRRPGTAAGRELRPDRPGRLVQRVPPGPRRLVRPAELPVAGLLHQGPGPVLRHLQPGHPRGPGPHLPEGQPPPGGRSTSHACWPPSSPARRWPPPARSWT